MIGAITETCGTLALMALMAHQYSSTLQIEKKYNIKDRSDMLMKIIINTRGIQSKYPRLVE